MPETVPVAEPTGAIVPDAELHMPPLILSVSVALLPIQRFVTPAIAPGEGFTVKRIDAMQPSKAM
jgi:hypothetical protein